MVKPCVSKLIVMCVGWPRVANLGRTIQKGLMRQPALSCGGWSHGWVASAHDVKGLPWKDICLLEKEGYSCPFKPSAFKQGKGAKGKQWSHVTALSSTESHAGHTLWTKERKPDILWILENHGSIICCKKVGETEDMGWRPFKRFLKIMAITSSLSNAEYIEVSFKNSYRRIILCNCKRETVRQHSQFNIILCFKKRFPYILD